jgi:hypothetical protein
MAVAEDSMTYDGEPFARGMLIAGSISAVLWGFIIIALWWTL